MKLKQFDSYEDYIALQKEKTLDPVRREKWAREVNSRAKEFEKTFNPHLHLFNIGGKGICLGARTGEEVISLRNLGMKDCIGIDLVPFEDWVIEGDVHNLDFEDDSVNFVYSNIFDHVLYPDKFLSECFRILKVGGVLFVQLQLGVDLDKYGVLSMNDPKEFVEFCRSAHKNFNVLFFGPPKFKAASNHGLNCNVILEKRL